MLRTVVDTFSRISRPSSIQRFSYRAEDVVATLERACVRATGYPKTIRVDQGSEFVSRDLDLWAGVRRGRHAGLPYGRAK